MDSEDLGKQNCTELKMDFKRSPNNYQSKYRISVRIKNPNPLFKKWLMEWVKFAKSRKKKEQEATFKKALTALEKYPLPLKSGRECLILDGFGFYICEMLDKKLQRFSNQKVQNSLNTHLEVKEGRKQVNKISPKKGNILMQLESDGTLEGIQSETQTSPDEIIFGNNLILAPGSFKIILLVDAQETLGLNKRSVDATIKELEKHKINFEVRRLSAGDFAWIARNNEGIELILPFIVERKRLDDLAQSIKSGRFHEQKFRLQSCGIPNVIYLIEFISLNHYGLPLNTLSQAVINAEINNGCQIKFSDGPKETILFLSVQTNILEEIFSSKVLYGYERIQLEYLDLYSSTANLMSFSEFNSLASKWGAVKVRDFFIIQLIQLFQISVEKAMAITNVYPTPRSFLDAFREPTKTESDRRNLIANIVYGVSNRTIGAELSKTIYNLFNNESTS